MTGDDFMPAVPTEIPATSMPEKKSRIHRSHFSCAILTVILLGCFLADVISVRAPDYLDLQAVCVPPCADFWFGTDPLGRDLFSMIWHGGRISLFVGFMAAAISTVIAVIYGSISGAAPTWVDEWMTRAVELMLAIPSILMILFVQAVIGQSNPISIALVIGVTSWMNIARVVRDEVRCLRSSTYLLAAKTMGGGFWVLLRRHLLPNLISPIMFMVVTNFGAAIGTEATLSFLGIGLPVETVSWGCMLSQAERALLSNSWWVILIPGVFLVLTLVCIADIGNRIRKEGIKKCSNL